ncbi:MAG: hypothetical protein V1917_03355 [Candidatus Gottesmanbacteria bacterium]
MKNKPLIIIISLIILLWISIGYWYFYGSKTSILGAISESIAIETLQNKFPELREYPNDNLPPKSIKTEKTSGGWYVAFIQEGSGVPIIDARCFLVKNDKSFTQNKYIPQDNALIGEFSARECKIVENTIGENTGGSNCALETCHGLDIKCGVNPPGACTAMYAVGDRCLQYATCGIQNGTCQQIQNSQFTECKLCIQKCIDANRNDTIKLFECEGNCN